MAVICFHEERGRQRLVAKKKRDIEEMYPKKPHLVKKAIDEALF